jgi:hypothetical protein
MTTRLTDEQIAERARSLTMRNPRVYFAGWAGGDREDITEEVRSLLAEVRDARASRSSREEEGAPRGDGLAQCVGCGNTLDRVRCVACGAYQPPRPASPSPAPREETPAALPPEILEILRDAKDGTTGVCIRERAAAAIVARDLCPRCAGTGQELLDTGPGGLAAWGTCHGCRPPDAASPGRASPSSRPPSEVTR